MQFSPENLSTFVYHSKLGYPKLDIGMSLEDLAARDKRTKMTVDAWQSNPYMRERNAMMRQEQYWSAEGETPPIEDGGYLYKPL